MTADRGPDNSATLTVRVSDMPRWRLFVYELCALAEEMSAAGSPHSERLDRAIERFRLDGPDDVPPCRR